ncbi:MAG: LysR family transcriptional regulator [Methylobacterium frigidaeris]
MTQVSLRIDLGPAARIGPGKVRLLELIAEHGSISAAGRALGMSYRRAWMLVADLNRVLAHPVVEGQAGGPGGGGASLTPLGADLVRRYRAVERAALAAAEAQMAALALLGEEPPPGSPPP